ncbi:MAG: hydrolase [Gammaproteobacteria bacterium]|nr:hydrolase [Gammaproteobacteria bacterium]
MSALSPKIEHLFSQTGDKQSDMLAELITWCDINTGSTNYAGLMQLSEVLLSKLSLFGGSEFVRLPDRVVVNDQGEEVSFSSPPIVRLNLEHEGKPSILLVGHYDTVYDENHVFQNCTDLGNGNINGPGIADLKGGLSVMFKALECLQEVGLMEEIGIEVLLNPDEEIGSPCSGAYLVERAKYHDVGLIFEPSLPDGTLVGERKGSGNFTIRVNGKSAHAGRDIESGRNALVHLTKLLNEINALHGQKHGLTVNIANIQGGGALNVVPDLAVGRFNCRIESNNNIAWLEDKLAAMVAGYDAVEGYQVTLFGGITRRPKPLTKANQNLQNFITETGGLLGIDVAYRATGGVCDGNNLSQSGLPNVDTLGVRGGDIHSINEYMVIDSLAERSKFVALILIRMANGEFDFIRDSEKLSKA